MLPLLSPLILPVLPSAIIVNKKVKAFDTQENSLVLPSSLLTLKLFSEDLALVLQWVQVSISHSWCRKRTLVWGNWAQIVWCWVLQALPTSFNGTGWFVHCCRRFVSSYWDTSYKKREGSDYWLICIPYIILYVHTQKYLRLFLWLVALCSYANNLLYLGTLCRYVNYLFHLYFP